MGNSPVNPHNNWAGARSMDRSADYDRLIDKLVTHPDPEVVYVSGMISWHNQIYRGSMHSSRRGRAGSLRQKGHVRVPVPERGQVGVSEVGLPVAWNHAEFKRSCR